MNRCDNAYCSSVCCMYAIKEAVIAKEHGGDDLECAIFYMDMRTHGKDFEKFYNTAKDKHGVDLSEAGFTLSIPDPGTDDLEVRYTTDEGEIETEVFDQIVLSVGMQISPEIVDLAKRLDIELTDSNFCKTQTTSTPVQTSTEWHICLRRLPGPQRHSRIGHGSQFCCLQRRHTAGFRPGDTCPGKRVSPVKPRWKTRIPRWACLSAIAASTSAASPMCPQSSNMLKACPM